MKSSLFFKIIRLNTYLCALLAALAVFLTSSNNTLYLEDLLFIIIVSISYILLAKLSININGLFVNLCDYIIIISYFIFNIKILVIVLWLSYLSIFLIDRIFNKYKAPIYLDKNLFNFSRIIISIFLSHILLSKVQQFYGNNLNLLISIILFSCTFVFLSFIILMMDELFYRKPSEKVYTSKLISYISVALILSILLSYICLYLYTIFQYTLVLLFTLLLIFISYALNKLISLKKENSDLAYISQCYNKILSKTSYNNKLYSIIETIEKIIPFYYCGIYHIINKHEYLYPLCYKNDSIIDLDSVKLENIEHNEVLKIIESGKPFYTRETQMLNSLNINLYNNSINAILILPLYSSKELLGCIFIALHRYENLDKELELLNNFSENISLICNDTVEYIKNYPRQFSSYNKFLDTLEKNIINRYSFTLCILEIKNQSHIINKFSLELLETIKKDVAKEISLMLSSYDSILYCEKDDIFILFNLQNSLTAEEKLKEISNHFKSHKLNNTIEVEIIYSTSEYSIDGVSKEDLIAKTYRKLYSIKEDLC